MTYLRPLVTSDKIIVGDYTAYNPLGADRRWEIDNVLYHDGPEKLIIGRYCGLASGVRFIMPSADHPAGGISSYPFPYLFSDMQMFFDEEIWPAPPRGDTVLGNDVWIGVDSTIMPGRRIGNGAKIAAGSMVVADVEPYTIVGGNPAKLIRRRYTDREIEVLERVAWWDWPVEAVRANVRTLVNGTPDELERVAIEQGLCPAPLAG